MNIEPLGRKVLDLRHVGHIAELPRHDYIAKGLLEPGTLAVIFGESGSGKTFLAKHLCYRISQGQPVFGRRTKQAPTLYIGLEGAAGVERRVSALVQRWHASGHFFFVTQPLDLLNGLGDAEAIMDAAEVIRVEHVGEGPKLIVIDTLARAMGYGSENEGADMGGMIAALDAIRRYTGACVALVHHAGKDKSRGMRGHSSLFAACDTVIEVERSEQSRSFRIVKSKDGVDGESFGFELDVVQLGTDEDGDPITSCVVKEGEAQAAPRPSRKLSDRQRLALTALSRLVADRGEQPPAALNLPTSVFAVPLAIWREELTRCGAIERDAKNPREDFRRLKEALQSRNHIAIRDELVWTV